MASSTCRVCFTILLLSLAACAPPDTTQEMEALDPERLVLKIDKEVSIIEPGPETGLAHEMVGMVRHPDGTIFVNTETQGTGEALGFFKSTDQGETWEPVRLNLADAPPGQRLIGSGVTRDGRLWLVHQSTPKELFVSWSADVENWNTTPIDFRPLGSRGMEFPYVYSYNDYNTFIEQPDGTLMFSVGLRYHGDYYKDPKNRIDGLMRSDLDFGGETMFRSTDGGKTWGDTTIIHPHVTEVGHALDPFDPNRILSMTRTQRELLAGEDREATIKRTGAPSDMPSDLPSIYKNGLLMESADGGRTFHEVPGGLTEFYGHRATIVWGSNNLVVVAANFQRKNSSRVLRFSLDGGRTWVDGTSEGTREFNQAKRFPLLTPPLTVSFTSPMLELSPNHYLSVYAYWENESLKRYYEAPKSPCPQGTEVGDCPWLGLRAVFWHLENAPEEPPEAG